MKKPYIILIVILIAGLMGGIYGWFFVYNKPHTDFSQVEPIVKLDAKTCFNAFAEGDPKTQAWIGQVIEINGIVQNFEQVDSLSTLVFVINPEGAFGPEGIRCVLLPQAIEAAKALLLPTKISIKGYCSGYNETDLVLEQCTFTMN